MDYNVRYNIDVKSKSATDGLYGLQNTSKQIIPKIISDFGLLNKSISKVNTALVTFNKLSRSGGKKIKFTLDTGINAEIKKLQSDINKVKGVRIRSTTGKQSTPSSTTVLPANTGSSTRTSTSRNGMNRGARGFGNGARGLYGLSDVMYAAGFPFPNMLGAAALGMGAFSIAKNAAEYENIMTTVQSILKSTDKDFVTFDKRFADMSHNIRQVGVQTKFTTTEVAGAAKFLGMAGMSIEDINNSIKPIANLAIVGDAPLDRMADIVTNIQTAYGLNSSDMPQIADILTSVTTSSNTSILEMGEAMKFAAPMMSMAKVSFNEAAAAIGALGNAGLKGTVAGTALRAMMTRLLNPTTAGLKVLEKYKVSLYEIDKATGKVRMRSLFDIFSQLRNKDASVQDLKTIFDKIGGNAANNIFAELYKLPELIHNSIYSSGISETIAGKKQETIAGKWDRIRSQFTETGMGIFESYNPVIKNGMDNIIAMLQNPGTAKMFSDIAAGLLSIIQMLIQVTQWVTSN